MIEKKTLTLIIISILLLISLFFNMIAHFNYNYNKEVVLLKDKALDLCLIEWRLNCEQECLLDIVYSNIETGTLSNMKYYRDNYCRKECYSEELKQ